MERVGEHPIPAGPLAVRWLAYELPDLRAGAETPQHESRSETPGRPPGAHARQTASSSPTTGSTTAATRSSGTGRGSTSSGRSLRARRWRSMSCLRAPQPPGRLSARFRPRRGAAVLVRRGRLVTARTGRRGGAADRRTPAGRGRPRRQRRRDHGGAGGAGGGVRRPGRGRNRAPRRGRGARAGLVVTRARRSRRGIRRGRRLDRDARPVPPPVGARRRPQSRRFAHPLLLPSLLAGIEPSEHEGLPAYEADGEPSIFDGRIRLRLPRGRPRG